MDIKSYLDREFPELRCDVMRDEENMVTRVRVRYQIGFEVPLYDEVMTGEDYVGHMLLESIYKAIGNFTVMAEKVRSVHSGQEM